MVRCAGWRNQASDWLAGRRVVRSANCVDALKLFRQWVDVSFWHKPDIDAGAEYVRS